MGPSKRRSLHAIWQLLKPPTVDSMCGSVSRRVKTYINPPNIYTYLFSSPAAQVVSKYVISQTLFLPTYVSKACSLNRCAVFSFLKHTYIYPRLLSSSRLPPSKSFQNTSYLKLYSCHHITQNTTATNDVLFFLFSGAQLYIYIYICSKSTTIHSYVLLLQPPHISTTPKRTSATRMSVRGATAPHPSIQMDTQRTYVFFWPVKSLGLKTQPSLFMCAFSSLPVRIYINKYPFIPFIYPRIYITKKVCALPHVCLWRRSAASEYSKNQGTHPCLFCSAETSCVSKIHRAARCAVSLSQPALIYIYIYSLLKPLIYPALYNIYTGRACTCSTEKNIRLLGEMFVCCVAAPYLCVEKENRKMHVWGPVAGGVGYMM